MKRSTKRAENPAGMFPYVLTDDSVMTRLDSVHKLGLLEDIEEELGIDLITLFKALKNGVWVNVDYENKAMSIKTKEIRKVNIWSCLDIKHKRFFEEEFECYFKDYGKTWALTREELENGN